MNDEHRAGRAFVMACGVVMLLLVAAPASDATVQLPDGWGAAARVEAGAYPNDGLLSRLAHRLTTHAENSTARLWGLVGTTGVIWISLLASALVFLLVAAVSSATDLRMLAFHRIGFGASSRNIGHGMLTFLRILRDRRTPTLARLVLVGALVYWLVPRDLIPDDTLVPGFLDDLLIAAAAAKAFIYLCPESLVARHAAAVEARA